MHLGQRLVLPGSPMPSLSALQGVDANVMATFLDRPLRRLISLPCLPQGSDHLYDQRRHKAYTKITKQDKTHAGEEMF